MTRSRAAAAALALALVGLGAWTGPARAAQPTIVFAHLTAGADVKVNPVVVDGDAHMANGGTIVGDVRVEVTSADGRSVPPATLVPAPDGTTKVPFSVKENLPYNGRYSARVTATGRDPVPDLNGDEQIVQSVDFTLDAPPAPPAGTAAAAAPDRGVALSWRANGEPDLVGYRVERAGPSSSAWAALATVATTRYSDTTARDTGGDFRYRVTAVRRGSDPAATVASAPSSEARASVPPPPAATTSPAGGGSGTATGPRVDISDFAALLDRASSVKAARPDPADSGFRETLPFTPGAREDGPADTKILGSSASETRGSADHRPLAFLAGSLLATVLLAHVLWVRNEIRKADELEALAPAISERWEPEDG